VSLSGPSSLDGLLERSDDNNQLCFFGFSGEVCMLQVMGWSNLHLDSFLHHKFSH
jgi:hypothetical protein